MPDDAIRSVFPSSAAQPSTNLWSEYEIEAKTSLTDVVLRNLKYGDAFAVLDRYGDIGTMPETAEGLFYRDTRFLSHFELRLEGKRPLLLSSAVHEDKAALTVELTNPDIMTGTNERLPRDTIYMQRTKFLRRSVCYERLSIKNYGAVARYLRIDFLFDADFCDLFEVRGTNRLRRGSKRVAIKNSRLIEFCYRGLDGIERRAALAFEPPPARLDANRATIKVEVPPFEQVSLVLTVSCSDGKVDSTPMAFLPAYREIRRARRDATAQIATVKGSNQSFNAVMCRATSDIYTLVTRSELGAYPYAGIPWFNTVFGRDGIITAIFMLWVDPAIARVVLRTLAATQATMVDSFFDAEPGKILHEMRHGEMANIREVPFGRYYGTVDATPLFVMLAGLYLQRTGDVAFIREIWPNIKAALNWIDQYGDVDRDGFVEYARAEESGLANQGWKDSYDAIFHKDGSMALGPIALCEVQAYVFAAKQHASRIAHRLGVNDMAAKLMEEAERLRKKFEADFWCDDLGAYAIALDGNKKPCRILASNTGHALFAGIVSPQRARSVAARLLSPGAYTGWGVRTLATGQARFNPMSYHNGSVWPHDNALIAMGFARYGLKSETSRIFSGLFDAAVNNELSRLPELFCGFSRRPNRAPTPYPVACSPQAWAAAAAFGLIGACLGLELSHEQNEIRFRDPVLPAFLDELVIRNLSLGNSLVDIRFHRYGRDVTANILAREGDVKIALLK